MTSRRIWGLQSATTATILRYHGSIRTFAATEGALSSSGMNLGQLVESPHRSAGTNLDNPVTSSSDGSDITGYEERSEVSGFYDSESESESENEDEDGSDDEDVPYTEDWEAPPSETPSDSEDEDIPDGRECVICSGCRQVTIQFASCSHGACNTCLKGIYRSRRRANDHFPTWFPCHICRAETWYVGEISQQENFCDFAVQFKMHGDVIYTVWSWVPIRRWIAKRSKNVALGLMYKAFPTWRTSSDIF